MHKSLSGLFVLINKLLPGYFLNGFVSLARRKFYFLPNAQVEKSSTVVLRSLIVNLISSKVGCIN